MLKSLQINLIYELKLKFNAKRQRLSGQKHARNDPINRIIKPFHSAFFKWIFIFQAINSLYSCDIFLTLIIH